MTVPATMPAAVYREKGRLDVVDVDTPTVGPHDVLLEVSHCGVCGSDLHFVLEGWGTPDAIEGHEYTGTIVAVGREVTRWARRAAGRRRPVPALWPLRPVPGRAPVPLPEPGGRRHRRLPRGLRPLLADP